MATTTPAPTQDGHDEPLEDAPATARGSGAWRRRVLSLKVLLPTALLLLVGAGIYRATAPKTPTSYVVPQSAAFEDRWGVRFNQVDVLGDGGLVEVGYTVIDVEKAIQFQSDVAHPPVIHSDARDAKADTTSQMRPGHNLRPGTNFFLLYSNPHNAIRAGETVSIEFKGSWLRDVPVR